MITDNQSIAKHHMGLESSRKLSNRIITAILIVISIIWLLPFVFILFESFRVDTTRQSYKWLFPDEQLTETANTASAKEDALSLDGAAQDEAAASDSIQPVKQKNSGRLWGFDNFAYLLNPDNCNFLHWYTNTLIVALFTTVLQTIIVLCMSYTLSRFRFKMRKPLMKFMLVLGMFPGMLTMIILYRVLRDIFGMTGENAVPGYILVYIASSGMGYYVSKGFFDTISKSLDEAARIDGATRLKVLLRIILPLSKPIVIYTILTAFMAPWGDYVFARYVSLGRNDLGYNVAIGLTSWMDKAQINSHYTHFCAGGVLVALPVTIVFMCLQRYYVEGVTGGAVKG